MGEVNMTKWKQIGRYYDMTVEENGRKRRLIDFTGKIVLEYIV
jgi:hypothetical protein